MNICIVIINILWSYQVLCDGEHSLERCQKVTNPVMLHQKKLQQMTIVVCSVSKTKQDIMYQASVLTNYKDLDANYFKTGDRESTGGRLQSPLRPPRLPWGKTCSNGLTSWVVSKPTTNFLR